MKRFRTNKNYYIYSVFLNKIFRIDEESFRLSKYFNDENKIKNILSNKYKNHDIFKSKISHIEEIKENLKSSLRPKKLKHSYDMRTIKSMLNNSLGQLSLEITTQCNLRCKYCIYSGKFNNYRIHSNYNMDLKIALKAIDYYIPRTDGEKHPIVVSYYGGEPLLNFDLIKKTNNYIKKKYKEKNILMHVTTNGTLINNEIARFFIENNFLLSISLDGPKEINDRYRVFPSGKGSFEIIKENLLKIKELDDKYYDSNVHYQPVLAPPFNYCDVFDFFLNDKLFSPRSHIKAGYVNLPNSENELQEYDEENKYKDIDYIVKQEHNYLFSNPKNNENYLFYFLFMKEILKIATRMQGFIAHTKDFFHVPGICLPGKKKIFVDLKGNFHMCEKVELSMPIGNVEEGLDYKRIKNMLDEYCHISEKDCCNCWAIRLCGICFTRAVKNGKFDLEFKRMNCDREKSKILKNLIVYMELLEKNPNALEKFKNTIWFD